MDKVGYVLAKQERGERAAYPTKPSNATPCGWLRETSCAPYLESHECYNILSVEPATHFITIDIQHYVQAMELQAIHTLPAQHQ